MLRFNVLLPFEMDLQESTAIKDVLLSPDLFLIKSAKSVKKSQISVALYKKWASGRSAMYRHAPFSLFKVYFYAVCKVITSMTCDG